MADVIEVRCGVCSKVLGLLASATTTESVQQHQRECALPDDYAGLKREFPLMYREVGSHG